MEIKYERYRAALMTWCKHYPKKKVGSMWCAECQYCGGRNMAEQIVTCEKEETK